jgi:hypothetical protein
MRYMARVNLERCWWVAFAVLLLPRLAAACPMCASQHPGGTARLALLGAMLLLPFAVAFVVFRALRRAGGPPAPLSANRSRRRPPRPYATR